MQSVQKILNTQKETISRYITRRCIFHKYLKLGRDPLQLLNHSVIISYVVWHNDSVVKQIMSLKIRK